MKYPFIKLYGKTCIMGKAKTETDAMKSIIELKERYNPTEAQQWRAVITANNKRKVYQWDYEISFYEQKTLDEMKRDGELL